MYSRAPCICLLPKTERKKTSSCDLHLHTLIVNSALVTNHCEISAVFLSSVCVHWKIPITDCKQGLIWHPDVSPQLKVCHVTHKWRKTFASQIGQRCYASACDWPRGATRQPIRSPCVSRTRRSPAPTWWRRRAPDRPPLRFPSPDIPTASLLPIKLARLRGRPRTTAFLVDAQAVRQKDEGARSRHGHCRIPDLPRFPEWLVCGREEEGPQSDGQGRFPEMLQESLAPTGPAA